MSGVPPKMNALAGVKREDWLESKGGMKGWLAAEKARTSDKFRLSGIRPGEDADKLQLGKDFLSSSAKCLWHSHVVKILEKYMQGSEEKQLKEVAASALSYAKMFRRYQTFDEAKKVHDETMRRYVEPVIGEDGMDAEEERVFLTKFELACLNNTLVAEREEAEALFPTIARKFDAREDQLEELVNDLTKDNTDN